VEGWRPIHQFFFLLWSKGSFIDRSISWRRRISCIFVANMNEKRIHKKNPLFSHSACVLRFLPNCRSCAVSCRAYHFLDRFLVRSWYNGVMHFGWTLLHLLHSLPQVAKITLESILYEILYDGHSTTLNSRQTPIGSSLTADRILKNSFGTNLCPIGRKTKRRGPYTANSLWCVAWRGVGAGKDHVGAVFRGEPWSVFEKIGGRMKFEP
jgi:hypothetical protein